MPARRADFPGRNHRLAGLATVVVLTALSACGGNSNPGGAQSPPSPSSVPGSAPGSGHGVTAPEELEVDGQPNPLGVDASTATFSWVGGDHRPRSTQRAYELVVGTSASSLSPGSSSLVWDSGKVGSSAETAVPYTGPPLTPDTRYWWSVQTWDASDQVGPAAVPQRFDTGLGDGDWHAQWIWRAASATTEPDQYSFLRREVRLSSSPIVRATAFVGASQQYELWVNGARVGMGPSFSYPDAQYYQAWDITSMVRAGARNAVGVLLHWSGPGKGRPFAASGLIARITIDHADGTEAVVTDGSWKTIKANWIGGQNPRGTDSGDYVEAIDGTSQLVGWQQPGFDDSSWAPATVIGAHPTPPFTHLVAQQTRVVENAVTARSLRVVGPGSYVADFGSVLAAVPSVHLRHGVGHHVVTMRGGYLLDPGGTVSTTHGTQGTDMRWSYVERDGDQVFEPFGYLGFRYLEIDHPGGPLARADVVAMARHVDVPTTWATFSSSDATLDAVFGLAQHSALYGSQEQFVDTPTREKGPFLRDGFNISETAMRAFGESQLTRQVLLEFAASQARYWPDGRLNAVYPAGQGARDIPDYTEVYPEWVWQYYLSTGDLGLLQQVYPVLVNVSDYIERYVDPGTGLVTNLAGGGTGSYQGGIVDGPLAMLYGYDTNTVARTTVNELGVDAFNRVTQVAQVLGRPPAEVTVEQTRAQALTFAVNLRLARSDGIYVDGLEAGATPSTHASEHANAEAIAYGIVPSSRSATVGSYVARLGMQMGPMTVESLLRALHAVGRDSDLVKLLTARHQDGWASILAQGGTYTWETWRPLDIEGDSMSHAWGATVLVVMQEALLGVTPTSPGWATFDVVPPTTSTLTHASGTVPTPRGAISMSWQLGTAGQSSSGSGTGHGLTLRLSVPPNTVARVVLPARTPSALRINGAAVGSRGGAGSAAGPRLEGITGGVARVDVGTGSYLVSSTG